MCMKGEKIKRLNGDNFSLHMKLGNNVQVVVMPEKQAIKRFLLWATLLHEAYVVACCAAYGHMKSKADWGCLGSTHDFLIQGLAQKQFSIPFHFKDHYSRKQLERTQSKANSGQAGKLLTDIELLKETGSSKLPKIWQPSAKGSKRDWHKATQAL